MSPELGHVDASYFHSLIGVFHWMVVLGHVDICVEVLMMSSHLALPCARHLKEVLHIFIYLKNPTLVQFYRSLFERQDWSFLQYGCEEMVEELQVGMPVRLGQSMTMWVYVDSDHAGSELIVMKQATESVRKLQFKLWMMGIQVDEPAFMFGDNQLVLANTMAPASTLKKKSNTITFHFVHEGCACDEWRTVYIHMHDNVAVCAYAAASFVMFNGSNLGRGLRWIWKDSNLFLLTHDEL